MAISISTFLIVGFLCDGWVLQPKSTSIPFHLQSIHPSIHIVAVFNQTLLACVHNSVREIILPKQDIKCRSKQN